MHHNHTLEKVQKESTRPPLFFLFTCFIWFLICFHIGICRCTCFQLECTLFWSNITKSEKTTFLIFNICLFAFGFLICHCMCTVIVFSPIVGIIVTLSIVENIELIKKKKKCTYVQKVSWAVRGISGWVQWPLFLVHNFFCMGRNDINYTRCSLKLCLIQLIQDVPFIGPVGSPGTPCTMLLFVLYESSYLFLVFLCIHFSSAECILLWLILLKKQLSTKHVENLTRKMWMEFLIPPGGSISSFSSHYQRNAIV